MGPGEHPFLKFGHNALRIRDEVTGADHVYNFGTFSFASKTLLRDFFQGRLTYWLSRRDMSSTLRHYAEEHRCLVGQRLALSPAEKRELSSLLEQNALPENRAYRYDYFFDNCSTRLRDAIDRVTRGQLREALRSPATQTLRAHALRATADYLLEYLVLQAILGPMADRPVDRWAETFLPEMLAEAVRHTSLRSPDGSTRPLVQSEQTRVECSSGMRAEPPQWTLRFFVVGALSGLLLWGLATASHRHRAVSAVLGSLVILGGLLVGLLGVGLGALWTLTDHAVTYRNQNLLLLSPVALVLPCHGLGIVRQGAQAVKKLWWPSLILVGSALAALLLKLLPVEWQDNGPFVAFFLPLWAGLAAGARGCARMGIGAAEERPATTKKTRRAHRRSATAAPRGR
jgi:hypothetical protein